MRIIHVLHSHGYGGAENHALVLMKGQIAAGHEAMYAGPLDSWLGRACQEQKIPALHLPMWGLYDPLSHLRLHRQARQWGADVIHGHLIRGAHYAGMAGHLNRRPVAVCTAHATTAHKHMGHCAQIIAVSGAVRDNLMDHSHAASKVTVVYNGMPEGPSSDKAALRKELGIDNDCFAVVNAGRFIRDKGQDLLVQAMAQQTHPRMRLYLIGDPATEFGRQVQALAQNPEQVTYLGYRPDVQRLLPAFDAYALSSRREALPLSLIEAFAAKLPVVATTVGGVPEVVMHEETGLQVLPDNAEQLAQALTRLASDSSLAKHVAHAGRAFYERHLTAEIMVDRTLRVYQQCLATTSTT